jgi:hypothetical protein
MMSDDSQLIAIEQVRIGMFIELDLNSIEHAFVMNAYKMTNQQQLNELRALNFN